MSKFKKRLASRTSPVAAGRPMFGTMELSWILLAASGLVLFAYLTG